MWVDLGKIIVATGFEWLPKVQKIAQSGHTAPHLYSFVYYLSSLLCLLPVFSIRFFPAPQLFRFAANFIVAVVSCATNFGGFVTFEIWQNHFCIT